MKIEQVLNGSKPGTLIPVYIYILETHFGTYYCGITNNLIRRWKEHFRGENKYTNKFKPKKYVYTEVTQGYQLARIREKKIKRFGPKRFLALQGIISMDLTT